MIFHLLGCPGVGKYMVAHARDECSRRVECVQRLADARLTKYLPVMLHCDLGELSRRVASAGRRERHKWVDPDAVEAFASDEQLLAPKGLPEIEVTERTGSESAEAILRAAGQIAS